MDFAIKTLKKKTMDQEQFLEEARNMQRLHHRKIVQLMGVCTESEPFYIITEFMANGSLKPYLKNNGPKNIGFAALIDMAAQVVFAYHYN